MHTLIFTYFCTNLFFGEGLKLNKPGVCFSACVPLYVLLCRCPSVLILYLQRLLTFLQVLLYRLNYVVI